MVGHAPVSRCTSPASLNFSSMHVAAASWINLPKRVPVLAKPHEGISILSVSNALNTLSADLLFDIDTPPTTLGPTPPSQQKPRRRPVKHELLICAPIRKHRLKTLQSRASSRHQALRAARQNSQLWNFLRIQRSPAIRSALRSTDLAECFYCRLRRCTASVFVFR